MPKAQKFIIFVLFCLLSAHLILGVDEEPKKEEPEKCEICSQKLLNIVKETGLLDIVSQHSLALTDKENYAQSNYWITKLEDKIVYSPTLNLDKDDIEVFTSGTKYFISVRDGKVKEVVDMKQLLSSYTQQKCQTVSGKSVLMCDTHLYGDSFLMAGLSGNGKVRVISRKHRNNGWDDTHDIDLSGYVPKEDGTIIEEVRLVGPLRSSFTDKFVGVKLSSGKQGSSWKVAQVVRTPPIALFRKNRLAFSERRYAAVGSFKDRLIYMDFEGQIYMSKDHSMPESSPARQQVLPELTALLSGYLQDLHKKNTQSTFITAQDGSICLAFQLKGIDSKSMQFRYTHTRFFCKFANDVVATVTAPHVREELRSVQLFSSPASNAYYIMALTSQKTLNVITVRVGASTPQQEFDVLQLSSSASSNWHEKLSYRSLAKCDEDFDKEYKAKTTKENREVALVVGFFMFLGGCIATAL